MQEMQSQRNDTEHRHAKTWDPGGFSWLYLPFTFTGLDLPIMARIYDGGTESAHA